MRISKTPSLYTGRYYFDHKGSGDSLIKDLTLNATAHNFTPTARKSDLLDVKLRALIQGQRTQRNATIGAIGEVCSWHAVRAADAPAPAIPILRVTRGVWRSTVRWNGPWPLLFCATQHYLGDRPFG